MFEPLPAKPNFPELEERVLKFWDEHDIFEKSLELRKDCPRFVFYEGPPTANGTPHPGHCLTRAMKDLFPRYQTMCGKLVERKAGWDTHGLPVEVEVCKELGIHTKDEIESYGVEKFVQKCIESVFRYTREWEHMTRRLGFWVNLDEAYVTYHQSYVESVWWSLKTLFDRGLLYQGHKVVWWWAQGGTALSAGEVGEGYRTVDDPSVYVRFPLVEGQKLPSAGSIGVPPVRTDLGSIGVPPVRTDPGSIGVPPVRSSSRGVLKSPVTHDLSKRRRILPHWEAGGSTYFLTFRVQEGQLSDAERSIVLDACRHWDTDRMLLHAAVVMPDHVHLLCTPLEKEKGVWWSVGDLIHSVKGFTAKRINEHRTVHGVVWQREYFDRIIRTEADFDEKWHYIVTNPQRRGLPEEYPWVWVETRADPGSIGVPPVPKNPRHNPQPAPSNSHRRDADAPRPVSLLVWTTTPWTLVSNHFAAVGPDIDYSLVFDKTSDEYFYIATALVGTTAEKVKHEFEEVATCKGSDLVGRRYVPPFDCYHEREIIEPAGLSYSGKPPTAHSVKMRDAKAFLKGEHGDRDSIGWRVLPADFVSLDSGTGLVHEAPAFGEVDFDLLQKERQRFTRPDAIPVICAVAPNGNFNDEAPEPYRGRWVKDCDKDIVRELKERGVLLHQEQIRHEYPFCPRAENDPLIQYARKSWFVRTSQFKDEFLKNNAAIKWLPDHIQEGRFGDFLRNNVDWALSRERYWGTPLPIWVCEKTGKMEAIGSYEELLAKPGVAGTDVWEAAKTANPDLPDHLRVHKPYIDAVTYDSPFADEQEGGCGTGVPPVPHRRDAGATETTKTPRMRRVTEVIDCWWDAGSMPFAQWGFPHVEGSAEMFARRFPAHFISEAIDQTRGWFYGLLAISTMLFSEAASKREMRTLLKEARDRGTPKEQLDLLASLFGLCEGSLSETEVARVKEQLRKEAHIIGLSESDIDEMLAELGKSAADSTRSGKRQRAYTAIATTSVDDGPEEFCGLTAPYPQPYKACIVLGHIMGEDGLKMSKRKRNYKDPDYVFGKLGADAMRWYFYAAQPPWTTARFQEANIRDAQREFLVRLYNVFSFFTIYANIDGFDAGERYEGTKARRHEGVVPFAAPANEHLLTQPVESLHVSTRARAVLQALNVRSVGDLVNLSEEDLRAARSALPTGWRPASERSELDRWITSELHRTTRSVRESMDKFENFPAAGRMNEFVDALSNWYVRRSRQRFWRSEKDQDKWDAYNTLYEVLVTLSKLIAPFTPFFAETMYQNLIRHKGTKARRHEGDVASGASPDGDGEPVSVHLCDYPEANESLIDERLATEMEVVRQLVSLGRAARTAAKLKVRQPLALVEIILARHDHEQWLQSHAELIGEELNIKKVEFATEADHYVTYRVAPNFKALGPKFGKLAPRIGNALKQIEDAAAARKTLQATGELPMTVEGVEVRLTSDELDIRLEARPGWSAAQGRAGVVVVKTELTPELKDEGLIRELIHHVQSLRKDQDLAYEARITLHVQADKALVDVIRHFEETVRAECLAEAIEFSPPSAGSVVVKTIDDRDVQLAIAAR